MQPLAVHHVSVNVGDLDRAIAFYVELHEAVNERRARSS